MKQDTPNSNGNLFLAMILSLLVIVGWNWFYGAPQMEKNRQVLQQGQGPSMGLATSSSENVQIRPLDPPSGLSLAPPAPKADDRGESVKIKVNTPSLLGGIDLRGGRLNDLSLKLYHETPDPQSPLISLLAPENSTHPYWVETGFVAASGFAPALPKADSLWKTDQTELTPQTPVTLTFDNGQGLLFKRIISVDAHYMFTIQDEVENKGNAAVSLYPYAYVRRMGKPKVAGYAVFFEGMLGYVGDLGLQEMGYDALAKEPKGTKMLEGTGGWLGFTDKYWGVALILDPTQALQARFTLVGDTNKTYQADAMASTPLSVAPGAKALSSVRVFAGAKEANRIDAYTADLHIKNFDLMIDWGYFYFITKRLFHVLDYFYKLLGNFGYAILLVTVLVKAAFYPLANRSYASMAKMKALQPHLQEIKERYAEDKQKQQYAIMELYKREKVNPVTGCLPMLLQIPVFFALYKVIFVTIEMRHAPFIGWIKDLSAPDPTNIFNLFGLLPFDPTHIPVIGHFLILGIWPLVMGISMFLQMKMNPEPDDPVQKQMFAWMPVIFTFMLGSFPVGLVLYWTWNNFLSILQQYIIMRRMGVKIVLWDNLKIKTQKV